MTVATRPGVDFDPALPQMPVLLDREAMAEVLARSWPSCARVEVRFLRYKPGTNLVVHYDVEGDGARHEATAMIASSANLARRASKAVHVELACIAAPRAPANTPLSYEDDIRCLVQWLPLDISMPAMALAPVQLRGVLAGVGLAATDSDHPPERLAYKPRRRAVLKLDDHVLKLYARGQEFDQAAQGQRAASTLSTVVAPALEAVLREKRVTVQAALEGRTIHAPAELADRAGSLLARLHASDVRRLPAFTSDDQLAAAAASARLVGVIAPHLRSRVEHLMQDLERARPIDVPLVPSHGDFNVRQLLVDGERIAVTDFDPFCLSGAALDPATYAAYLVRGGAGDLARAHAVLVDLLAGYGARLPQLDWYLATMIVRRAPRPFRYFEADWHARVEQMVASAEAVLAP